MITEAILRPDEIDMCRVAGEGRWEAGKQYPGQGPSRYARNQNADMHIRGCLGEYAASLMLNLYWRPSVGIRGGNDIGGLVEVKCIVKEGDPLNLKPWKHDPHALIWMRTPSHFRFMGWCHADYGKRPEWFVEGEREDHKDDVFKVPQINKNGEPNLLPFRQLFDWCHDKLLRS